MLTFDKKLNHTLRIRVAEEYKYLVKVSVFDSNNRIVENLSSDRYEILFALTQGLYTLRIEMNGEIIDEVFLLDKDKEYQIADKQPASTNDIKVISPPKQYSSALLGETYGSSHEYYTYPAIICSKKDTFYESSLDSINSNSSLFIFLRFPSLKKYENFKNSFFKPFFYDFEIVDENGNSLTLFESRSGIELNEQYGWVAFNAKLPNGIYYLIYKGKEQRQVPIYVFKNWHTQFFMTLGNEPLYGTIRIFLSKQREFNPNERTHKYIDILLDKLQNEDYSLDNELIEMAAYGKYESPMLGLICSYIYLKSKDTKNDQLFQTITRNMQNVVLKDNFESPDLRALNILASYHFPNYIYKKIGVQGTPMLRIGFEILLKASVENKRLIPQNSINDFISENLYFDSPFNTFKPIAFRKKTVQKQDRIEEPENVKNVFFKPLIKKTYFSEDKLLKLKKSLEKRSQKSGKISYETDKLITLNTAEDIPQMNKTPLFPIKTTLKIDKNSISIKKLFDANLFGFIKNKKESDLENSWIKSSIVDIVKTRKDITINDISRELSVSGNTINRIFNEWEIRAKKK
jgi:hypothetical protein